MEIVKSKIHNHSIQIVNDILIKYHINELDKMIVSKEFSNLNGNKLWPLFEYYSCLLNNVIPWNYLPFNLKEELAKKDICRDFGIDGISNDLKISLQSKCRDGTNISFREIGTFNLLSNIIGCDKLILDMLNTSKYTIT